MLRFKTPRPVREEMEIGEARVYDVVLLYPEGVADRRPVEPTDCGVIRYPGQPDLADAEMPPDVCPARVATCFRTRPVHADGSAGEWGEWKLGPASE